MNRLDAFDFMELHGEKAELWHPPDLPSGMYVWKFVWRDQKRRRCTSFGASLTEAIAAAQRSWRNNNEPT